jgi:glyoxylase-like metal-dependent hydrolase (beta-lactamase superfamily II)
VHLGAGERHGLHVLLRERTNVPLDSLDRLRRHGGGQLAAQLEHRDWGEFEQDVWAEPDEWLTAGEVALDGRSLLAIPTPGHTQGHVVFLDRENGLLFAGDHVLPHITPSIGFDLGDSGLPLLDYLDALQLVTDYPDARLLPAHGPVTASVHQRVAELLVHHEDRFARSLGVLGGHVMHAYDVAKQLTWTRRERRFSELDEFNQMLAVTETAAHLDVLVVRGEAIVHDHDGTIAYERA